MTISYELAAELKESGFPQVHPVPVRKIMDDTLPDISLPTLEELIEACNGKMNSLHNLDSLGWVATHERGRAKGSTPTEAVARLWLALNKP